VSFHVSAAGEFQILLLGFDPESIGSIFSDVGKAKPALKIISNRLLTDAVSSLEKDGIVRFLRLYV
jgi:hypothetical protein